jgi:hypothetical protein
MGNPNSSYSELAGSAAHALNNVLSVLYAASARLEGDVSENSAESARRAIERASTITKTLSAALSLTSLEPKDIEALVLPSARQLKSNDIDKIVLALQESCNVESKRDPGPWQAETIVVDFNTLESVLVCIGAAIRHTLGKSASLSCSINKSEQSCSSRRQLSFEFAVESEMPSNEFATPSRDPCSLALLYVSEILPQLGLHIVNSEPGKTSVTVELDHVG